MNRVLLLLALSCSTPSKRAALTETDLLVRDPSAVIVTGRVVSYNGPVHYFGITNIVDPSIATPVRTTNGRFVLKRYEGQPDHFVIAGPGFARMLKKAPRKQLGEIVDLGTIFVTAGFRITGTVSDETGPVAGARVTIRSTVEHETPEPPSPLTLRAHGFHETITDAQGNYRIDNVVPLEPLIEDHRSEERSYVTATLGEKISPKVRIDHHDQTTDFKLAAPGRIEVITELGERIVAKPRFREGRDVVVDPFTNRTDLMLPGTYDVEQGEHFSGEALVVARDVVVHPDLTTQIHLALPENPIAVSITMPPDAGCAFVFLREIGSRYDEAIAKEGCSRAPVTIKNVAPGSYEACVHTCNTIEVNPSPAAQTFMIADPPS